MSPRPRTAEEVALPASKTQIDRAGRTLREWWNEKELELDRDEYDDEARLVIRFREGFQEPSVHEVLGPARSRTSWATREPSRTASAMSTTFSIARVYTCAHA